MKSQKKMNSRIVVFLFHQWYKISNRNSWLGKISQRPNELIREAHNRNHYHHCSPSYTTWSCWQQKLLPGHNVLQPTTTIQYVQTYVCVYVYNCIYVYKNWVNLTTTIHNLQTTHQLYNLPTLPSAQVLELGFGVCSLFLHTRNHSLDP